MKYLAILILSLASFTANAQHRHGYHHHHHHGHYNWVAPLVIGGIAGYAIANRPPPAPVVVQTPPNGVYSYPSEMIYIDGVAYRRERIYLNGVWQDVLIRL